MNSPSNNKEEPTLHVELQDMKKSTTESALLSKEKSPRLSPDTMEYNDMSQINFIDDFRRKASQAKSARIDNEDLFHQKPTIQDMCTDTHTSAVSMIHGLLFVISLALLILLLCGISPADILVGCIAVVSNLFGIAHSMYSGSITNKAAKLDNALQKLAVIFAKFAKALDIQESYLDKTRNLLDYLDLLLDAKLGEFKAKCRAILQKNATPSDNLETEELIMLVDKFEGQLRVEVTKQHVLWLRTLFDQFHLLDHRTAIKDNEYNTLKSKLPGKSHRLFNQLSSVDRRMRETVAGVKILPYSDLNALVNKVIEDLQASLESNDRMVLPSADSLYKQGNEERIFHKRLSVQIQGAKDSLMGSIARKHPPAQGTADDDDIPGLDDFLLHSVDIILQEEKL